MSISLLQARKILGSEYIGTRDETIQQLLEEFYGLSDIISESIIKQGSKNEYLVIDPSQEKRDD